MSEKLLPKPVTLEYVLRRDGGFLYDRMWRAGLCLELFAKLMNVERFPQRVRVTVSTRPITGAAKVYVKLVDEPSFSGVDLNGYWQDLEGNEQDLTGAAEEILGKLGATKEWLPIWIDFKRARSDATVSTICATD